LGFLHDKDLVPVPDRVISIIDDDESMLLALAGLLRASGFEAKTYGSAEEFIRSGCVETSSYIITDIQMPGLNGIELKKWLNDHSSNVPVIMITARSEPHLHAQALASGIVCLLKKPFEAAALLAHLGKADVD
jgi:FixJ family two-component response regulator